MNFIWAPSHCHIAGNDMADNLANQGCHKNDIDYVFPLSLERLKTKIEKNPNYTYSEYLNNLYFESNC